MRSLLAGQEGLEPPTTGFGDRDSSQLSYCPVMAWPQLPAVPPLLATLRSPAPSSPCGHAGSVNVNRHQWVKCSCPGAARRTIAASDARSSSRVMTVLAHDSRPPSHLRTCQRHHRIRHARRGRESEGTQGGRAAGDRLRRRRTGLPDARLHRGSGTARLRRAPVPPLLPHARAAGAAGGGRGEDGPRLGLPGQRGPGADHQRRQAGGLPGVCYPARSRRRGLLPTPYWTTYPEAIALAGGVRGAGA